MSSSRVDADASTPTPELGTVDMNLKVVTLDVTAPHRAKAFDQSLGWRLGADSIWGRQLPGGAADWIAYNVRNRGRIKVSSKQSFQLVSARGRCRPGTELVWLKPQLRPRPNRREVQADRNDTRPATTGWAAAGHHTVHEMPRHQRAIKPPPLAWSNDRPTVR
jgi:hypothetical protein